MSSEEWSQELTLAWWTDACLVRVDLCLRLERVISVISHPYGNSEEISFPTKELQDNLLS